MKTHPTDLQLEALYLELEQPGRAILDHLAECARCRERVADLLRQQNSRPDEPDGPRGPRGPDVPDDPSGTLGARALPFALMLARERNDAPELFVDLLRRPEAEREALLGTERRFHTWGLCELLVERSLETAARDPWHAEELGHLALCLSRRLDPAFYGPGTIEDLRARTWAYIANARRVRADFDGAEEAFAMASPHLQRGTQDPFEIAIFLDLEASLRRDQRRLDEAAGLFRKAARIFFVYGDRHRAGRSLFKLSTVHYFQGDLEEALAVLRRSLDLLDMDREPRLRLCAQHNLIDYLTIAGRFEEARAVYRETRPLYREFAEPWVQNRRKWVRARILRGLGRPVSAESLFLEAPDGFLAEGIPYDTALVSLEIATLYAEQARTAELKRLPPGGGGVAPWNRDGAPREGDLYPAGGRVAVIEGRLPPAGGRDSPRERRVRDPRGEDRPRARGRSPLEGAAPLGGGKLALPRGAAPLCWGSAPSCGGKAASFGAGEGSRASAPAPRGGETPY